VTTFAADADGTVVVIRNVPAEVCAECGEVLINENVAQELEDLVTDTRRSRTESLVRRYQPAAS
jgi:YgiT-type zinc finger domain-containing protein